MGRQQVVDDVMMMLERRRVESRFHTIQKARATMLKLSQDDRCFLLLAEIKSAIRGLARQNQRREQLFYLLGDNAKRCVESVLKTMDASRPTANHHHHHE